MAKDHGPALGGAMIGSSVKPPIAAADLAARGSGAGKALTTAPAGFGEVAAYLIAAAELAHRGEGAVIGTAVPLIGPADIAVETVGIDPVCGRLVVAVDVAADHIAEQAADHDTADRGAGTAVTGKTADQAAGDRAENGAVHGIAAVATLFIGALLVIAGRRRRGRPIAG